MPQPLFVRAIALIVGSFALACCATSADETVINAIAETDGSEFETIDARQLLGTWDVSLFFSASSPPSATLMEIRSVNEDGTIEGTFYNTEFEVGRFTEQEDVVAFSIITSDGSGQYATSGRLRGDGLVKGQTLSTGRDFLMLWEARRREGD